MSAAEKFKHLLQQPEILVVPGVYDCLSAQLAEQAGFAAVFTSGFGISAANLGKPDYGFITATENLTTINRIVQALNIPLVADLDTGYGNPLNVIRTVTDALQAGVAGVILEDQEWPKKCGHMENKRVISAVEHIEKIKAAVYARGSEPLTIIGRTDARAPLGLDEAIQRGKAYYGAGADVIFIEAPQSLDELNSIAQALPGIPLFANMIEGGKTPMLTPQQLQEIGYKIVVFPLAGLFAATQAIQACFQHLKQQGTTEGFNSLLNFQDFEQIINLPKYRELEQQFSSQNFKD